MWVRARFGGLVAGCGCDKLSLAGGLGGGVAPIVYVPLFLLSAYPCFWCGCGRWLVCHLFSVV